MVGALTGFLKSVPRVYYLAMLAAALLCVSAMMVSITSSDIFRHNGGDIWVYLVWMRCFSEQFWQGDIYPRWCMDVNDGLGTPLFMFYFPLPFYIASFFYPLILLGMSYYHLFVLLCFIATFLSVLSCYAWLCDVVEAKYALLASVIFVFLPYHIEMMYFRGAYAEIWCTMLLPLIFKYTRRLVKGEQDALVALAFLIGISALTHVPLTGSALIFSGLYMLAMMGANIRPPLYFGIAIVWGLGMAAFYLFPGIFYHPFMASDVLAKGLYGWPNSYLTMAFTTFGGLEKPLMAAVLGALLLLGFSLVVLIRHKRIEGNFLQRETRVWLGLGALSFFMLIPASAPLYALLGPLSKTVFPWRMQMIEMLAITYLVAVWMQWQISQGRRKTWKTDFVLSLFFMWVISNFLSAPYAPKDEALNETIREAKIVFGPEYRTRWTDSDHFDYHYLFAHHDSNPPKATIISGQGKLEVRKWGWQGIELLVDCKKPMIIRIEHTYFPIWNAKLYKSDALPLRAEDKTGLMLLEVPAGEHLVELTTSVYKDSSDLFISQWVSMASWGILVIVLMRAQFFYRRVDR